MLETATTEVRAAPASAHPLERYVAWLERVAESLAGAGAASHLMNCERLIGELRRIIRHEETRELGPLRPEIELCFGGMRSILRAVRAGELPLSPELRSGLVELVREITELVLDTDLAGRKTAASE
jgi:hypothetical protein